jgi:hypothetical protein
MVKDTGYMAVRWINPAQDTGQWCCFVKTIANFLGSRKE